MFTVEYQKKIGLISSLKRVYYENLDNKLLYLTTEHNMSFSAEFWRTNRY